MAQSYATFAEQGNYQNPSQKSVQIQIICHQQNSQKVKVFIWDIECGKPNKSIIFFSFWPQLRDLFFVFL